MRITIGNPRTKKFYKMLDVYSVTASDNNDLVLYITDHYGSTIALTFPNREALISALQDLRNEGSATAFCDYDYYHEEALYDDYDREIDPNTLDELWGYDYER